MIAVKNIRHTRDGVYVGRWNSHYRLQSSPLANPYKLAPGGSREPIIDRYARWLDAQLASDTRARREFDRLVEMARVGDVTLLCWCAPAACHADVIKARIVAALAAEPERA